MTAATRSIQNDIGLLIKVHGINGYSWKRKVFVDHAPQKGDQFTDEHGCTWEIDDVFAQSGTSYHVYVSPVFGDMAKMGWEKLR